MQTIIPMMLFTCPLLFILDPKKLIISMERQRWKSYEIAYFSMLTTKMKDNSIGPQPEM